jgi:pyridoxal phosphate enzyme (YggS family)
MRLPPRETLKERIEEILAQVHSAAGQAGRNPEEIRVLAVSKTHPAPLIREAYACGLTCFGENRVQEAEGKMTELKDLPLEWHLIGQLQTNKVKKALSLFSCIHSVDRPKLVHVLDREAEETQREIRVFLQVNIGEEESKAGVSEEDFERLLQSALEAPRLKVQGLMTVPPYFEDPEDVRPYFRRLRELGERYRQELVGDGRLELSMGMTHDFPVAIQEGATLVRIGTAIFGTRD